MTKKELVAEFLEFMEALFSKWSIVGSILRGHEDFRDLDLLILKDEKDLVKEITNFKIAMFADTRIFGTYKKDLEVNFFVSDELSWELARLAWGYGKGNLRLRGFAKDRGCRLNEYVFLCGNKKYFKLSDVERILKVDLPEYLKSDKHTLEEVFVEWLTI